MWLTGEPDWVRLAGQRVSGPGRAGGSAGWVGLAGQRAGSGWPVGRQLAALRVRRWTFSVSASSPQALCRSVSASTDCSSFTSHLLPATQQVVPVNTQDLLLLGSGNFLVQTGAQTHQTNSGLVFRGRRTEDLQDGHGERHSTTPRLTVSTVTHLYSTLDCRATCPAGICSLEPSERRSEPRTCRTEDTSGPGDTLRDAGTFGLTGPCPGR